MNADFALCITWHVSETGITKQVRPHTSLRCDVFPGSPSKLLAKYYEHEGAAKYHLVTIILCCPSAEQRYLDISIRYGSIHKIKNGSARLDKQMDSKCGKLVFGGTVAIRFHKWAARHFCTANSSAPL